MQFLRLSSLLLLLAGALHADVSLPRILGDNMVLQRGQPVPLWGRAAPGEKIEVSFAGQKKHTQASADGTWQLTLDPLPASAQPRELTITGTNTLRLANILVGEVWLCSGQSNMEYAVGYYTAGAQPATASDPELVKEIHYVVHAGDGSPTSAVTAKPEERVTTDNFPGIRLYRVEKKLEPADGVATGWTECRDGALAYFSAAGFFFGRKLQQELQVPIGLIQAAWGGSRIEPWTPAAGYAALKAFANEAAHPPIVVDGYAPTGRYYEPMVRPLAPFALRGVIWYQGESNIIATNDGLRYADKMEALITGWRNAWHQPALPFYYVQIAPFHYTKRKDPLPHSEEELPKLWEAQARALRIPHTGMVPTTDLVDDLDNIHPGKKRLVGGRLAELALTNTYGRKGFVFSGPFYTALKLKGSNAVVHFANTGGALHTRDGQPPGDFEIAGADGRFLPATAVIHGDTVIVSHPAISAPTAVRFAWRETAQPNLINQAGLPAYPFRSNGPDWNPEKKP